MAKHSKRCKSDLSLGGKHTTLIEVAKELVDILCGRPDIIKNITSGLITPRTSRGGHRRVRAFVENGYIKLAVKGGGSQVVHLYTEDTEKALVVVEEACGRLGAEFSRDKRQC